MKELKSPFNPVTCYKKVQLNLEHNKVIPKMWLFQKWTNKQIYSYIITNQNKIKRKEENNVNDNADVNNNGHLKEDEANIEVVLDTNEEEINVNDNEDREKEMSLN